MIKTLLPRLIAQAFAHRWMTLAVGTLVLIAGWVAFRNLPMEAYPDFTDPMVRVITLYPGKGAEEIERLITIPLEKELNGLPGQTNLRSISIFGLSVVNVTFADGTATQIARQQVLERLGQAQIPDDAHPDLDPDASPIGEIFRYTVESPYYNAMSLKAIEDWQLEKAFRQIPGVINVTSFGGPRKTYQIQLDPGRLRSLGVTVSDVFDALHRSNATTGANTIERNGQAYVVRGLGLITGLEDLGTVVIKADPVTGTPIRLRDVAHLSIEPGLRLGKVGKNANSDAVMGIVLMRRGQNPSQVLEHLYAAYDGIQARLPEGVTLKPLYDRMDLMRHTLDTIGHNVLEGIALVSVVLLVFLMDFRVALIACAVIPLSLLVSFLGLNLAGIPANLLSLGAVDFGMIVDGTVVLLENILRRLSHEGQGMTPAQRVQLTLAATQEVGTPIFLATLIIGVAFLPILGFAGVAGKLFRPLAFTMNFALLGALFGCLTLIPVLASFFLTRSPLKERESPVLRLAHKTYKPLFRSWLRSPRRWLAGTLLAVLVSLALFTQLGSEFLPQLDEGNIWLRVTVLPTSVSLDQSTRIADRIRGLLMGYPEVKNIVSHTGAPDDGTDPQTPSSIQLLIDLYPAEHWRASLHENKEALIASMDRDLENIPGIQAMFSQYIQDNVDEALSGAKGAVALKIYGPDLDTLQQLGNRAVAVLSPVPGLVDLTADYLTGQPQYQVRIDRLAAERYGLQVDDIENTLEVAIGGKVATQLQEGERRFDAVVRLAKSFRANRSDIANLGLLVPGTTTFIPLSSVAQVETAQGAGTILRYQNERVINVTANVRGRDLGSVVGEAQRLFNQRVQLPAGYHIKWAGQFDKQQEANSRLALIMPITLLVILALLMGLFRSLKDSLVALVAIPLTALGGVTALWLTHTYFSVSAGVGFIAASGVAVQNSVIILTHVRNLERHRNYRPLRALYEGCLQKLRPVLMAGTVAVLGLLPAALSHGIGSQSQRPFAIVIIGGLLVSTLLLPLVIPSILLFGIKVRHRIHLHWHHHRHHRFKARTP